MKCKCGVELFSCDEVESKFSEKTKNFVATKYRCPKCFKVTEV